jgi:sugar phosphate isomerase/epimerase
MKKAIQIAYNDLFELKCSLAAKVGFKSIAVNYTEILGKNEYEWERITERIGEILAKNGLDCVQSHPHYYDLLISSEIIDDDMEFAMRQSIISSGKLGAEYCVFHPRSSISTAYRTSASFDDNRLWFESLAECAAKHGTRVAAENLPIFPSQTSLMPFYSSNFEDLADLVGAFDDEVGICWDFGHANLLLWDQAKAIEFLGERIKCTHVHNNFGGRDDHATPDNGNIKWDRVMASLASVGYSGPLTLETHCNYIDAPLLESFASHNLACLDYLERLFSKKRDTSTGIG